MIKSVDELYAVHKERKHQSHQIYKTLYIDVMTKIKQKNDQQVYNLIYKPPTIIMGNTNYHNETFMIYLIKKLTSAGFIVFPNSTNLYIDWSFVTNTKKEEKLKKVTFKV
jgi:hypothetical protein